MIDIVIVNWNAGVSLVESINSSIKCSGIVSKIIVVDNGSTDEMNN